jgi:hypothetical protein
MILVYNTEAMERSTTDKFSPAPPSVTFELLRSPLQRTFLYSPRAVTLPTTANFPTFPSSCYASHHSILPYIPLGLLRSPPQRTSLYYPRAVRLPTTAHFPIFPSSRYAPHYSALPYISLKSSSRSVHRDVGSDSLHWLAACFCRFV